MPLFLSCIRDNGYIIADPITVKMVDMLMFRHDPVAVTCGFYKEKDGRPVDAQRHNKECGVFVEQNGGGTILAQARKTRCMA